MSQSDKIRTEGPSGQDTGTTSWILLSRARSAHIRAREARLIAGFHSYGQKEMSQSDKIWTEGPSGQDAGTTSSIL